MRPIFYMLLLSCLFGQNVQAADWVQANEETVKLGSFESQYMWLNENTSILCLVGKLKESVANKMRITPPAIGIALGIQHVTLDLRLLTHLRIYRVYEAPFTDVEPITQRMYTSDLDGRDVRHVPSNYGDLFGENCSGAPFASLPDKNIGKLLMSRFGHKSI